MNSLLPNMRLICLASDHGGTDWWELSQKIDGQLESMGMDLAQEETYLLFSEKEGCLVARPVIGPKKLMPAPLLLIDWVSAPVYRKTISGSSLDKLLDEAEKARIEGLKDAPKLGQKFMFCIQRELKPDLKIKVDSIFHE